MGTTVPPHEPGRHGWAELLDLVGDVRRLAYDSSLAPDDAMRRSGDAGDRRRGLSAPLHLRRQAPPADGR